MHNMDAHRHFTVMISRDQKINKCQVPQLGKTSNETVTFSGREQSTAFS